jgi:hypothetical protein
LWGARSDAVVVAFAVLEFPKLTNNGFRLVPNLQIRVNQISIIVGQVCPLWPQGKKERRTTKEGFKISIEAGRHERKDVVK